MTLPTLQWGRGLLAAEIATNGRGPGKGHKASMGPRLVSRGNKAAHDEAPRQGSGFNGAAAC